MNVHQQQFHFIELDKFAGFIRQTVIAKRATVCSKGLAFLSGGKAYFCPVLTSEMSFELELAYARAERPDVDMFYDTAHVQSHGEILQGSKLISGQIKYPDI